jgi:hypothetical protein
MILGTMKGAYVPRGETGVRRGGDISNGVKVALAGK